MMDFIVVFIFYVFDTKNKYTPHVLYILIHTINDATQLSHYKICIVHRLSEMYNDLF